MKRCLPILVVLFLISACDQVVFPEPQPRKIKSLIEIPVKLQGLYLDQDLDTLYVDDQSFSYFSDEYSSMKNVYLSDSSVLKIYKDHYFYNSPVLLEGEQFWLTYILAMNEDGSGFDLYAMDPGDVVKLAKLQEITSKVRDIEGEQSYYVFEPKKKDYKKIISDTIFTKMISFKKL